MVRTAFFFFAVPALALAQSVSFTPPRAPEVGLVVTESKLQDMNMDMAVTLPNGQTMDLPTAEKSSSKVRYEVLEVAEDGAMTQLKVTVEEESKSRAQGPQQQSKTSPLSGETFVLTKTEAGIEATTEAGEPLGPDKVEAATRGHGKLLGKDPKALNKFHEILEKDSYSVGDTIKVEGEKARRLFDDSGKGEMKDVTLTLTLASVEEVDGRQVALFDATMVMQGNPEPGMELKSEMSGQIGIFVDGSETYSMNVSGPLSMSANKDGMSMEGEGTMSLENKRTYSK